MRQCEKCGAEQMDMSVKPFMISGALPPEPVSQKEEIFGAILEFALWLLPVALGLIGHHFFGNPGAIIGVLIGMSPWLLAGFG